MEYSKEFKAAISAFSSKDKDRLIFRLLKKDKLLSKKLYFELIDLETTDDKREKMEEDIHEKLLLASKHIGNPQYYLSIIRKISAEITEHVKITTDKFGDVYLNLLLINKILESNENLIKLRFNNTYKLYLYLINKIFKTLVLIKKLDEDYWIEIDELFKNTNIKIHKNPSLEKLCSNNHLNFNWLKCDEIPKDIDLILKEIKSQGFLK